MFFTEEIIHGQKRLKKVQLCWCIYEPNLSFPHVVYQVILAAFIKRCVAGIDEVH